MAKGDCNGKRSDHALTVIIDISVVPASTASSRPASLFHYFTPLDNGEGKYVNPRDKGGHSPLDSPCSSSTASSVGWRWRGTAGENSTPQHQQDCSHYDYDSLHLTPSLRFNNHINHPPLSPFTLPPLFSSYSPKDSPPSVLYQCLLLSV